MYVNNWFKPIFPLSLTPLLHKLKFLIPMVNFAAPPPPFPRYYQPSDTYAKHETNYMHVIIVLYMKLFILLCMSLF